jgi:Domain of unknown function (DUF4382)/Carboxypeptidase regulatory-like domain
MNKHLKNLMTGTFAFATAALAITACQKGDVRSNETTALKVYLTDHPADFDKVLVNITTVEAKIDTGKSTCRDDRHGSRPEAFDHHGDDHRSRKDEFGFWQTLSFTPGSYDLLTLRNGVDTLLATGTVTGTIRKIRMGVSSVTVVKNGVSYPVVLSADLQNYIYVHVHSKELDRGNDSSKVWVDFDVARSIVEQNGQYYLRPVLKPFNDRNFGGLEGSVTPTDAGVVVTAYGSTDTATAIPDNRGHYCIRGLDGGSYKLVFDANNGYIDTTINNVSVTAGRRTRVAAVVLKK